jgi:hypothetical protein
MAGSGGRSSRLRCCPWGREGLGAGTDAPRPGAEAMTWHDTLYLIPPLLLVAFALYNGDGYWR